MPTRPVLIVDDNPVNRFALRALVERMGYSAEVAESGEQAIALVAKKSYAAILVDIMMPTMSGYEMAAQIRQHDQTTPMVAVTALDDTPAVRAACRDAGINDAITKPVDADALTEKLELLLSTSTGDTRCIAARKAVGE